MVIIELSFMILINILYIYSLKEYDNLFGKKKIADIFLIILLLLVGKYVSIYEFKTLSEIKFFKFLFDSSLSLNVYIGIISILVALYIYCISIGDDFKKYLLINLLGEGKVLFLSTLVLVLYFFEISPILFLGINLLIFTEIFKMIKLTFLVLDTSALIEEKFKNEIIPKIYNSENTKGLSNLYHEIKKSINKALSEKNFIYLEEMIFYYTELLTYEKFDSSKNEIFKDESRKKEDARIFIYSIYKYLIDNPDKSCYETISYINIKLGKDYLKHKKYNEALSYYNILKLKYKYLLKTNAEDLGFNLFEGIKYYENEFKQEDEQIIILRAVLSLFKMMVENSDYKNLSEFQEFFGTEYSEENLLKEYARLILLFFLENDKQISIEKDELIKKIKNYYVLPNEIHLLEKIYIKDKKYDLEEKFKISYYMFEEKINVLGIASGSYEIGSIQNIILKILDNNMIYQVSEEFLIKNYNSIKEKANTFNLKKIKERLEKISIK